MSSNVWLGADLAYGRNLHPLETAETSDFTETLRGTSFAGTLVQLSKKLPNIAIAAPLRTTEMAFQMFGAGFEPVQLIFHAVFFFLLKYLRTLAILRREIRDSFQSYDELTPEALAQLKYLQAFIHETLCMHLAVPTGMPRLSPGATVGGEYVPRGPGPRQCTGREITWSQTRLFLGEVLWTFDLEPVSGHEKSFDEDFSVHAMWNRPDLYVRLTPAKEQHSPAENEVSEPQGNKMEDICDV
ncbi:cytochrome P450 [Pochonia chlamydosporia 170]|uniref:Cytochrome P450 n=1 Tax=Pochonia chlamydosporia 170 TaxID=1380566 RepID=A0A179FNY5_METCM|nr:cytochrome P450 [Pochonia chlamydosporia 170]OAQ66841.1 cytochrome P450 [Pochonia chlamydosporia 170]